MPRASNSIVIDRPCGEVFDFLADSENDRQWRPGVLDIKRMSGDGIGAVYKQGVKGPFGRRIDADFERSELEAPSLIGFRALSGPVRPAGRYELVDEGGRTRVTFSLEAEPRGLSKLISPLIARTMGSEVRALDRLREVPAQRTPGP